MLRRLITPDPLDVSHHEESVRMAEEGEAMQLVVIRQNT